MGDETGRGKRGLPRASMMPHTGRCHTPRCSPHPPTGPILKTLEGHLCVHRTGASGRQRGVSVGRGPLGLPPVTLDGAALLRVPELGCPQAPLRPRVTPLPALGLSSPPPPPRPHQHRSHLHPGHFPQLNLPTPSRFALTALLAPRPAASVQAGPDVGLASAVQGPHPEHSIRWAGDGIPAPCTSRLLRGVCLFS